MAVQCAWDACTVQVSGGEAQYWASAWMIVTRFTPKGESCIVSTLNPKPTRYPVKFWLVLVLVSWVCLV